MLVLSRRIDEDLVIHAPGCAPVTVRVKRVAGDRVSIGIEAPEEVKIRRGELRPFAADRQPESTV